MSVWTLGLGSELVEAGPASQRHGVEIANYYSPYKWLVFDADLSLSKARFTNDETAGTYVPEAVGTVVSAGASVDGFHRAFGSVRMRYFGSRALTQDDSVPSKPTTLVNLGTGYELAKNLRVTADIFNVFDARDSDIDYYFTSRLPGGPLAGVDDVHFHPAVPRTLRVGLVVGF